MIDRALTDLAVSGDPSSPATSSGSGSFAGTCFSILLLLAVAAAVAYWLVEHQRWQQSFAEEREQVATLLDPALFALQRAVLGQLYRSTTDSPRIRDVAAAAGLEAVTVAVVTPRMAKDGWIEFVGREGKACEEPPAMPTAASRIRLTPAGSSRYHSPPPPPPEFTVNGDFINNTNGGVVNNRSTVVNAFNTFSDRYTSEVAEALRELERVVRESGSVDGNEQLAAFLEQLEADQPKRSVLRSLFAGIKEAVPALVGMADLTQKISSLFS